MLIKWGKEPRYFDSTLLTRLVQKAFPDVKGLINNLHDIGFKGVWMVDPGLKVEKGYEAYDTGSAEDVWIQNADGKPYVGMSFHHFQK